MAKKTEKAPKAPKEEMIGQIAVDAGVCWIGDPCYVFGDDASRRVTDWGDFANEMEAQEHHAKRWSKPLGDGFGFCVSTGMGDGFYPVTIKRGPDGRVTELTVRFGGPARHPRPMPSFYRIEFRGTGWTDNGHAVKDWSPAMTGSLNKTGMSDAIASTFQTRMQCEAVMRAHKMKERDRDGLQFRIVEVSPEEAFS